MRNIFLGSMMFFICLYGGAYIMNVMDKKQWYGFPVFITIIIVSGISVLFFVLSVIDKLNDTAKK